ncbi:hypothetical protein BGX31_004732 [Mortierella sp. GBA43]|nr:hypothetical protein BGX31_004732 [Mortierella sp. GBA43]
MTLATLQSSAPSQFEFVEAPRRQMSFDRSAGPVPSLVETLERHLTPEQIEEIWGEMSNPDHPAHERCTIL